MAAYGLITVLVGSGLLAWAAALAAWLHRRFGAPYPLLTVGIITYIAALGIQAALLQVVDRALLGILPLGALTLGVLAGFSEETLRALGYQVLAPGAVTRPQALMIGAGHGLTETIYTALIAISVGLAALSSDAAGEGAPLALASRSLAEALNGALPAIMHMALSWLVLQAFLRGELYWLFVAIFTHATVEIMATLLGPNASWNVVGWRALVALGSAAVIVRLRGPMSDLSYRDPAQPKS